MTRGVLRLFGPHHQVASRSSTVQGGRVLKLYSVGDCPVCWSAGALLVLLTVDRSKVVLYCPSCGTAWLSHPRGEVNEIEPLKVHAPDGVVLPSWEDLQERGLNEATEVAFDDWKFDLVSLLGEAK